MLLLRRPDVNGLRTNKNVKGLVKALGWRKDRHVRGPAVTALGQLGDPRAVNPLIRALNDSDSGVRGAAATALGDLGDDGAAKPLITVIQNDEWSVREAAVAALGNIGAHAVGPLIAAPHDQDEYVRRAAAEALGQIGDPRAVEALTSALDDESAAARQAAAEALGQIGDPDAVEPLIGARNDQNAKVRVAAAAALDGLAWSPDRGATGAAYWVAKGQWKKCVKIAAIEPLIAVLRDDRVMEIRDAPATRTLVKIGARAVGPLIGSLNDQNGNVRQAAAGSARPDRRPACRGTLDRGPQRREREGASGYRRSAQPDLRPACREPLIGALKDNDRLVREDAARALGKIGDPRAVNPLIAALHDLPRSLDVQRAAASSLVSLYSAGVLDEGQKARVLGLRAFITRRDHVPEHEGVDSRDDETIGVDFPL